MSSFDSTEFERKIALAIERAKTVLNVERNPEAPLSVGHKYDDKFALANTLTTSTIDSQLLLLHELGVSAGTLTTMMGWLKGGRSVTLRFASTETCTFIRHERREEDDPIRHERSFLGIAYRTDKTVHIINEWFWNFEATYQLFAFAGNDAEHPMPLQERKGHFEIVTTVEDIPRPKTVKRPTIDINITWLLQHLSEDGSSGEFDIDRNVDDCRTPRRNPQVNLALAYLMQVSAWASKIEHYFMSELFPVQTNHGLDLRAINDDEVFVPVIPLFEERQGESPVLRSEDLAKLRDEQKRSLSVALERVGKVFPGIPVLTQHLQEDESQVLEQSANLDMSVNASISFGDLKEVAKAHTKVIQKKGSTALITTTEAHLLVILLQLQRLTKLYGDSVGYIEHMLYRQLVSAIGKEVTETDFANYMLFHNRKIFREEYLPRAFAYAIRRGPRDPEGILSIEAQLSDGSLAQPIHTIVRSGVAPGPMRFNLDASTQVEFGGERHLHAFVSQKFSGSTGMTLSLVSRARQFSSFILMVGRIGGADLFEPTAAIIIKDKDELSMPLMMETIPTPKEFKDAISSLSPEQQRFAKAYRGMQLAGTLFAICVVQIKPQLEKLLNLPDDTLTKEIRLTQDLMELFIKYQIPSDLMVYEGSPDAPAHSKVAAVKAHVKAVQDMLQGHKAEEIKEAQMEVDFVVDSTSSSSSFASSRSSSEASECEDVLALDDYGADVMEDECYGEELDYGADVMEDECYGEELDYAGEGMMMDLECAMADDMMIAPKMEMMEKLSAPPMELTKKSRSKAPKRKKKMAMDKAPQKERSVSRSKSSKAKPSAPKKKAAAKKESSAPRGGKGKREEPAAPEADAVLVIKVPPAKKVPQEQPEQQRHVNEPEEPEEQHEQEEEQEVELEDYTLIPRALDAKFERLDTDSALRPTIINLGPTWTLSTSGALLADQRTTELQEEQQVEHRSAAFDLLDALSRSGDLPMHAASLHVVLAATHCFDRTLIDTLVKDNVNPVEKLERSALIIATTIQAVDDPALLLKEDQLDRIREYSAHLFL